MKSGKLKLGKNFFRELVPVAMVSALVGGVTVKELYRTEHKKTRSIITDQRQSIGDLTAELGKCVAEKPIEKEPEPVKPKVTPTKEPVKILDTKKCVDARENRYSEEMTSCTGFFNDAMYMAARNIITCKTARHVHKTIGLGMNHCDRALDEARNPKEKRKAKLKKRELLALSMAPKVSPPICNISRKR